MAFTTIIVHYCDKEKSLHPGRGPPEYFKRKDRELDIHILESGAYRQLKERGLCDGGIVPRFFGTMDKFHPRQCLPYLKAFVNDEYFPSAIFLDYTPNMEMIQLHNYTRERTDDLIRGIQEIPKVLLRYHKDPKSQKSDGCKERPEKEESYLDRLQPRRDLRPRTHYGETKALH
ncbi:conserved hypothetical protein [Talaromyces stipitatus ATCC 10500]|uniref:Uncharacterized protein n=1 Tax=Talaromyces stipitatus (strain ATCC 10500 / CBS 375.48 / QM 6759 / NRRL 1006) TaxID=441959 RepID=B8M310_TALSN|nr:uncharacterized protein TSTA_092280 [Talaromyces stipitatus ATCC 10500]EED21986.1 conserved hypothetical protein [Talaromyces stipitatus ATCC 10500]